ncbi:unnamed protein product [Bemisia tabaci]|uniref:Major facilitator superfamily (MFS) profile domain-containing protein n=2 Tax=Bemisia tabaci TaxID=7038 RepID=A0A9P0A856_BEMTA|nr:unnamed protein product [Bemisia tabaci]
MYFTSYVSRRFSTILSALLMTVSSGAAGVYEFVFRDAPASERPYQWLPIVLLVAYIVFGIIGVTTLPWMMSGEVFPLRVRGAMSGAVFGVGAGSMFVFIKIYEDCLALLNIWGLLFGFAIASFLTALLGIFLLPETLNKTHTRSSRVSCRRRNARTARRRLYPRGLFPDLGLGVLDRVCGRWATTRVAKIAISCDSVAWRELRYIDRYAL